MESIFYLKDKGIDCIHNSSYFTCEFPELEHDVTVLFHGGGNLGDIYHEHIDFLIKLVKKYPENRILVFPQTVFYNDRKKCDEDLKIISSHKNIYICARDSRSHEVIKPYFKQRALLVPDMAFCIPLSETKVNMSDKRIAKELILLRKDGELSPETYKKIESCEGNILDWPTFYHKIFDGTFVFKCIAKLAHNGVPCMKGILNRYCAKYFHKKLFNIGVSFFITIFHYIHNPVAWLHIRDNVGKRSASNR